MKLEGKVALITGGGGAMGGAQARLFASEFPGLEKVGTAR